MATKNKITDVRDHLIMALERINDLDLSIEADQKMLPMELDRAKQVVNISNAITETARAEVEYIDLIGKYGVNNRSEFFPTKAITGGE